MCVLPLYKTEPIHLNNVSFVPQIIMEWTKPLSELNQENFPREEENLSRAVHLYTCWEAWAETNISPHTHTYPLISASQHLNLGTTDISDWLILCHAL